SSQLINQERNQSQRANISQTNTQWLQMDFLSTLSHPAMIPPIDIMENRPDIYKKCLLQLSAYVEELDNELLDADTLIPIRTSGRHVVERDSIKIIAQDIIKNNLSPEEINGIAYILASSAFTTVARNSWLNLLRKKLHKLGADYLITKVVKIPFVTEEANQIQARKCILRGINGYDCPEFFYLEKVQERLNECDITKPPSMQNLIDSWYNPNYSWYCIGYTKNKGERSIPDRFPFLLKDKNENINVAPLNQFLSRYKINSFILRKIGADHASRVYGGRNDSCCQYLQQLAYRHKIGHASSVEHYGVINDRPNTPAPKQENSEVEDIID
ncbi:30247_t:CDS:2, partial [Gigaspora margarita]